MRQTLLVAQVTVAVLFSFLPLAIAQSLTSLSGTVVDPTDSPIPGAPLKLTNAETGVKREYTSDGQGRYSFQQLAPGHYELSATAAGFQPVRIVDIRLLTDTPATINLKFDKLGATATEVSVTADSTQLNTTDASLGNAIGERPIQQLPFEARNVVGLLALQPGVTYLGDPGPGNLNNYRSGSVNGGKSDQGNVTLDGVDVNDQVKRAAFTSVLRVTLDSVQEFRTITSNSGAEYGRSSGGQVVLVTKSGTNQLHGSLYEFDRNTVTSANSFFNNSGGVARPKLIRNVFGAAAGGALKKDRLFLFSNYEGRRDRSAGTATRVVPTANFRNGIVNYVKLDGTIGQLTPAQIKAVDPTGIGEDAAVLKTLQAYPLPNISTVGDGLNSSGYIFNSSVPLNWDTYIAKLDWRIDQAGKHALFWRGNLQQDNFTNTIPQFPGQPTASATIDHSKGFATGYTAILSPYLVSTARYGFTRQSLGQSGVQTSSVSYLAGIDAPSALTTPLTRIVPVHQASEDLNWNRGAHSLSFGFSAYIINNRSLNYQSAYSTAQVNISLLSDPGNLVVADAQKTSSYQSSVASLLGLLSQVNGRYNYSLTGQALAQGSPAARNFATRSYESYAQDTWKVTPELTVTAGLRLTLAPPVAEVNGYQTSTSISLSTLINQRTALADAGLPQTAGPRLSYTLASGSGGKSLYPFQHDFAPRLGIAFAPKSGDSWARRLFNRSVIRAGAGLYYDNIGQGLIQDNSSGIGFSNSKRSGFTSIATAPRYTGFTDFPTSALPPAPGIISFPNTPADQSDNYLDYGIVDRDIKSPYSISLNFSIAKEFSHGWSLQAAYVGRLARHALIRGDVATPANLKDNVSGTTLFQAEKTLTPYIVSNTPSAAVPPIPYFENLWPGLKTPTKTATQVVYEKFQGSATNHSIDYIGPIEAIDAYCSPSCSKFGPYAIFDPQFASLWAIQSRGTASYNALQVTIRKAFSQGLQLDLNYTYSKSLDLASTREAQEPNSTDEYAGYVRNIYNIGQSKSVSDFDTTHNLSAFWVAEVPVGHGKKFLANSNRFLNGVVGGWQLSGIFRVTSGLPANITCGGCWNSWYIVSLAGLSGPVDMQTTKNAPAPAVGGTSGANLFPNPASVYSKLQINSPNDGGPRNIIRGDGYFTLDGALDKKFNLFTFRDKVHSLQVRAEGFNLTNSVRFDPRSASLRFGTPATFGKYSTTLTQPRVFQFGLRYSF